MSVKEQRITTAVLSFFLGGFGGQKFYLGRTRTGILCLLFFWTTVPAWIAIYDLIMCLALDDAEWAKKYLTNKSKV